MPDVVGKPMTLARQMLEDKKLRVNIAETYDATVPAGSVVSQDPVAGSKVKESARSQFISARAAKRLRCRISRA